jgi:hypothetical protein
VAINPVLSAAMAVNLCVPKTNANPATPKLYGATVKLRSKFVPSNNCTFVTDPVVVLAVVVMVKLSVLPNAALLVGLVIMTVGVA